MTSPFNSFDEPDFQARQQMAIAAAEEARLRHDQFIEDLPKEQLATFVEICQSFLNEDSGVGYIHFMLGASGAVMRMKHKACICGEDHLTMEHLEKVEKKLNGQEEPAAEVQPETAALGSDINLEEFLKDYNMKIVDHRLYCAGCGLPSISVNDRMLRRPGIDGCSGCQQKAAFG